MPLCKPCTVDGVAYRSQAAAARALAAAGLRSKEIARRMGLPRSTVDSALYSGAEAARLAHIFIPRRLAVSLDAMAAERGMNRQELTRRLLAGLVAEPGTMRELLEDHL